MSVLDRFLPPPGAPGAVRAAAGVWRDCGGRLRGLRDHLEARSAVLGAAWWGPAKEAFVASAWPFLRQLDAAATDLQHYADTLDRLADGIEAAQREYHARMIAVGATLFIGGALTVLTAGVSDEAAAGAAGAELAAATELAATAATEAASALSMLTAQAAQLAAQLTLRVALFTGVNVAGDAVGAAVAYDDGTPWAHLHLRDDLEWGAAGALAVPLGAGMLGALTARGVPLTGAAGTAVRLGVGGLSMAQADALVRTALGEHVDATALAMAAIPLGAAGHGGGRPSRLPPGGVAGIVDQVHLPPGPQADSELFRVDLAAHDAAGGHAVDKHVGKTEADLRARLAAEPNLTVVSSFSDRWTAERVIAEALRRRRAQIESWLRGTTNGVNLDVEQFSSAFGLALPRGATAAVPTTRLVVVLRRSASMPGGYYVLTVLLKP